MMVNKFKDLPIILPFLGDIVKDISGRNIIHESKKEIPKGVSMGISQGDEVTRIIFGKDENNHVYVTITYTSPKGDTKDNWFIDYRVEKPIRIEKLKHLKEL